MLKKIFYWVFSIIQVFFLIGAYGIQYFSMKRMGMMRYVVFKNHEWEAQYHVAVIKYAAIALLVILCVILYLKTKNLNNKCKKDLRMIIVDITLTIVFVLFTLIFSTGNYRSYYFTSLILSIVTLIQHIKVLITSSLR